MVRSTYLSLDHENTLADGQIPEKANSMGCRAIIDRFYRFFADPTSEFLYADVMAKLQMQKKAKLKVYPSERT